MVDGRGPTRAAVPGAVVLVCILLAPSCILPPDIEAPPAEVEQGPVIDLDKVRPAVSPVGIGSACTQDFTPGPITDENAGDTLYYRWYVDYGYSSAYQASGKIVPPADGSTVRAGPTFTLDAAGKATNKHAQGDFYLVEVIVADRPFEEDSSIQPAFKVISAGGRSAYYAWLVQLLYACPE